MKAFRKILKGFLILILTLIFGTCTSIFLAFNIVGYEALQINSDDMEPDLYAGDVIIIKPATVEDVEIGDIVTFQIGYNKVTHKVVAKENGVLSTQGSNLNNMDTLGVDDSNIKGVMLTKMQGGKHFILFVTNPGNMIIVVCITLGLLLIPLIMKVDSDDKVENKNTKKK